ncbi:hypothetical protein Franean1_3180 [Parafrankia sp. EAN1pec]|nr:hypothetical protein Franean1_3180 [Frankia sp. EAN1pec]
MDVRAHLCEAGDRQARRSTGIRGRASRSIPAARRRRTHPQVPAQVRTHELMQRGRTSLGIIRPDDSHSPAVAVGTRREPRNPASRECEPGKAGRRSTIRSVTCSSGRHRRGH